VKHQTLSPKSKWSQVKLSSFTQGAVKGLAKALARRQVLWVCGVEERRGMSTSCAVREREFIRGESYEGLGAWYKSEMPCIDHMSLPMMISGFYAQ